MKKKLIALTLVITIVTAILILYTTAVKAETYEDSLHGVTWTYTVNSSGEATNLYISKYTAASNIEDIYVPESIDGHTVVSIGNGTSNIIGKKSTYSSTSVKTVDIPDTVTTINPYAFYNCNIIKTMTLPEGVTSIGDYAFYYCKAMISINIPDGVTNIGENAFNYCIALKEINIPTGITNISTKAFYGCSALTSIEIPANVKTIGESAFSSCSALAKVTIAEGVETIGASAFYSCSKLADIEIPTSVKTIENKAFYSCKALTGIELPNSVEAIEANTFAYCTVLKEIEIPNSVTTIGTDVFYYCTSLAKVTIPDSVTSIGARTFQNCTKLTDITLSNSINTIEDRTFYGCSGLEKITIPNNVEKIGAYAFANCSKLAEITIPDNVETIGEYAFSSCSGLAKIEISTSVKTIKNRAFMYCTGLTGDLNIPDNVNTIEEYAFYGCRNLNGKLTVGTGVDTFNNYVFDQCNFKSITLNGIVKSLGTNSFNATDILINHTKEEINLVSNDFKGRIHYKNCHHKITVSTPNGIKVKNKATGAVMETGEYTCEDSFEFYIDVASNVNKSNLKLALLSVDNDGVETVDEMIPLSEYNGTTYQFSNLLFDKKIVILNLSSKAELTLRTYVSEVNGMELAEKREPVADYANGEKVYYHTKKAVSVNEGDVITYVIRVYNQGAKSSAVNEITEYLPEGLEFFKTDRENLEYGWKVSDDGKKLSTKYLAGKDISGYNGIGTPNYVELKLNVRVTAAKDIKDIRLVNIAEITSATEADASSNYGSITKGESDTYKKAESDSSNSSTYVKGHEKDDDFENVVLSKETAVSYELVVKKVDRDTKELLNGAEFQLLDENKNLLNTGVTVEKGILDFGLITRPGEGVDTYYLAEKKTPQGYEKVTKDEIKLVVTRKIKDKDLGKYEITVESNIIETEVIDSEFSAIPIYTREQLEKIGSEKKVKINGDSYVFSKNADYVLMNDIDLSGDEWEPIQKLEGNFEGNGHTIKNMTIDINKKLDVLNIGLFASVSGEIQNLNLTDINISVKNMTKDIDEDEEEKIKERLDSIHVGGIVGYFEGGRIKNCKVSGTIDAESNSVGGFIGYSKGYALVTNSTNNANVKGSSSNVGGIIGVANNSVSLSSCTNNGEISAESYNAGGLVGYAQAGTYEQTDINVAYADSKIVVVVENKKISDEYSLVLENRDIETLGLLKDGKFVIYDVTKDAKYENIVLNDGTLKIADISINTLGTDTYYIEQLESTEKYDKNENYVKVIVTKSWNGETEDYELAVNYEMLTKSQFRKETAKDESYSVSSSGKYFSGVEEEVDSTTYVSKSPVIDTISATNSINKGNITAGKQNAAGIIGKSLGNAEFNNCKNEGNMSSVRSSGLLAESVKDDAKEQYVSVKDCSNKGEIIGSESASGILGRITADSIKIADSKNSGKVEGGKEAGAGIIAESIGNTNIQKCKNEGSISGTNAAGIISKSRDTGANIKILDSTNTGDISGSHASGIFAYSEVDNLVIDNCASNNGKIEGSEASGILGWVNSNTTINNCNSNGSIINGSNSSGILGFALTSKRISSSETKDVEKITISNCLVKDAKISGSAACGVLSKIISSSSYDTGKGNLAISDVNLDNTTIEATGDSSSGICGFIRSMNEVIIKDCSIKNSNFTSENGYHQAGVVGVSETNNFIMIDEYNMENTSIAGKQGNAGVIFGTNQNIKESLKISNINIKDCEFEEQSSNVGGLIGYTNSSTDTEISNVNMDNFTVKAGNASNVGGLIGTGIGKFDIKKVDMANSSVSTNTATAIGGFIGCAYGNDKVTIKDCNITNPININATNVTHLGGVVGLSTSTELEIENLTISTDKKEKIDIQGGSHVGGIIGYIDRKLTLKDVTVDGVSLNSKSGEAAGIVGVANNEVNCNNVKVKNIDAKGAKAAGIIGITSYPITYENIEVNKANLEGKDFAGGIAAISTGKASMNDAKVIDVSISGANGMAGVIAISSGSSDYNVINKLKMQNLDIQGGTYIGGVTAIGGINITNSSVNKANLESDTAYSVGGIAGNTTSANMENCTVNNITIDVDVINNTSKYAYIGGLSGIASCYSTSSINNCHVTNSQISASCSTGNVGGLFGIGNTTITNSTLKSSKVTVTSSESVAAGGIAGYAGKALSNCDVKSSDIKNKSGRTGGIAGYTSYDVNKCTVTGGTLKGTGDNNYLGGIVGAVVTSSAEITNNEVKELKVSNLSGYTGGIAGYTNATVSKCKLLDSEVKATSDSAYGLGGIIGHASNQVSNYTYISDCEVSDSKLSGAEAVGGIAGAASPYVNECNIAKTNITGDKYVGGIVGFGGNRKTTATTDQYLPITITKCELSELIIKASKNVSETIGLNSYNGISGEDKVTDCTITDCELPE